MQIIVVGRNHSKNFINNISAKFIAMSENAENIIYVNGTEAEIHSLQKYQPSYNELIALIDFLERQNFSVYSETKVIDKLKTAINELHEAIIYEKPITNPCARSYKKRKFNNYR